MVETAEQFNFPGEGTMSQKIIKAVGMMVVDYTLDGLDRNLTLLEDLGCESAEISPSACKVICGGALNIARLRQILPILAQRDLLYTVHSPLILNFMDEIHLELHKQVCRASIEWCARIGAKILVIHPGWITAREMLTSLDRLMELERSTILELAREAADSGVKLALENMPAVLGMLSGEKTNYGIDPLRVAEQVAAIDHPNVCATLDFSHAYISANFRNVALLETLKPYASYVNHLHVHDSVGRPPSLQDADTGEALAFGMGDLHLPLGWGTLEWERILPHLPIRPGTVMTVEIAKPYVTPDEIATSLQRARQFAEILNQVPHPYNDGESALLSPV